MKALLYKYWSFARMFTSAQWRANRWRVISFALVGVIMVLLMTGCGPSERNTGLEKLTAPTSPLARGEGEKLVKEATKFLEGVTIGNISNTGSMEPILNSSTIPIYLPSDGVAIAIGQIVTYKPATGGNERIHRVADLNSTHFIPEGVANARYDGWIPRSAITRVVVGVIYTEGRP